MGFLILLLTVLWDDNLGGWGGFLKISDPVLFLNLDSWWVSREIGLCGDENNESWWGGFLDGELVQAV